ncbi:hypothetical protein FDP41_009381 [Naegleria fowleri]|uniref:Uncharacterized protein n=1 Tax=Naegleria fowleri TaxID=5763 RepID=A0A6A5BEY2_NAEFO|nr:uncharacterized protein FDP41_009381 [Naegleria fowleri]KAF0972478.1 hypothetical protein FDP41_009381 [Naegleria fowleri]CAG4710559.1 unnamed protein product [Naegleria fowleri]
MQEQQQHSYVDTKVDQIFTGGSFVRVHFKNCAFCSPTSLVECFLENCSICDGFNVNCKFVACVLSNLNLNHCTLERCSVSTVTCSSSQLKDCTTSGGLFASSDFSGCTMVHSICSFCYMDPHTRANIACTINDPRFEPMSLAIKANSDEHSETNNQEPRLK